MEKINVVSIVERELKNRHITYSGLARKLSTSPSTIQGMFSRPTLQVKRLLDLSAACNYNFFREIADLLPYAEPTATSVKSVSDITGALNDRIKELETEVKILRQTIKDIAGK